MRRVGITPLRLWDAFSICWTTLLAHTGIAPWHTSIVQVVSIPRKMYCVCIVCSVSTVCTVCTVCTVSTVCTVCTVCAHLSIGLYDAVEVD